LNLTKVISVSSTGEHGAWGALRPIADPEDHAVQQLSPDKQQTQFASRVVWCMPRLP